MKPKRKAITDKERLDWLEEQGKITPMNWYARVSVTGRGFRLHQDPGHIPDAHGFGDSVRSCIDAAIIASRRSK
jgi:hypothetical protein